MALHFNYLVRNIPNVSYTLLGSLDLDGNVNPTFTAFTFSNTVDGVYSAIVTCSVDTVSGGTLTHNFGRTMRSTACWRVKNGTPTMERHNPANQEAGGAFYLINTSLDPADMDLDIISSGGNIIVRITPSVFVVARYQIDIELRGPVT